LFAITHFLEAENIFTCSVLGENEQFFHFYDLSETRKEVRVQTAVYKAV
jgi:hypothetical protein